MQKILIVDDEPGIRNQLSKFLNKKGYQTAVAADGAKALEEARKTKFNLALLDFRLPDIDGLELLKKLKIISPKIGVVIITAYSDVRIAVNAIRAGAFDYVTKPLYPDEILITIEGALSNQKSQDKSYSQIVFGESSYAHKLVRQIDLVAPTDMTVVVMGETGTGKEYVARAIHEKSNRKKQKLVEVDCGALPENLAGSELFGHVKGAFTGSLRDKKGSFEQANGGTLFLDEIGNLTYENQVRLLRVLQERKVKRIGGERSIPVDVRVIAATNDNLQEEVKEGRFREDLYHRIKEFDIMLPPLRERRGDVEFFLKLFLDQSNQQLEKQVNMPCREVIDKLTEHHWHGNLRELRNVVKRAVLFAKQNQITLDCLPEEISGLTVYTSSANGKDMTDLKFVTERAERNAIIEILEKTNFNKTKAAKLLNVDRKTLYNKIKSYRIESEEDMVE